MSCEAVPLYGFSLCLNVKFLRNFRRSFHELPIVQIFLKLANFSRFWKDFLQPVCKQFSIKGSPASKLLSLSELNDGSGFASENSSVGITDRESVSSPVLTLMGTFRFPYWWSFGDSRLLIQLCFLRIYFNHGQKIDTASILLEWEASPQWVLCVTSNDVWSFSESLESITRIIPMGIKAKNGSWYLACCNLSIRKIKQ